MYVCATLYPPHSDPMCQEAVDIVTGDCPALAEKMYNCSNVFENRKVSSWMSIIQRQYCTGIDIIAVRACRPFNVSDDSVKRRVQTQVLQLSLQR